MTDRDGSRPWLALARLVPIDQVPGLGGALYPITFIALQLITNVYYTRAGLYAVLGAALARGNGPCRHTKEC